MRYTIVFGSAFALIAAMGATGKAQEQPTPYRAERVNAPSNALELKVGTGYTQGFGNIAPGHDINDVAGAGIGVSADIDYRIDRRWSLGVEGQYQEFTPELNNSARGVAANFGGTYHFAPVLRGDPWIRLGTGYRLLWENGPVGAPNVGVLRHGFELATAKLGYDVRVSEDVAVAPVIGAGLDMFLWEDPSYASTRTYPSAQMGTFIYAGVQGRFDIGGERTGAGQPVTVTAAPVAAPPPPPPTKPVAPTIAVSEDILQACKLDLNSVEKAPKFDTDKADLLPGDLAVLQKIGECFSTGPMKGLGLTLVGRADPRGTVAHNQDLGMRRATRVSEYLQTVGVQPQQIETTSRGKIDSRGTNESVWRIERRVDILERE